MVSKVNSGNLHVIWVCPKIGIIFFQEINFNYYVDKTNKIFTLTLLSMLMLEFPSNKIIFHFTCKNINPVLNHFNMNFLSEYFIVKV